MNKKTLLFALGALIAVAGILFLVSKEFPTMPQVVDTTPLVEAASEESSDKGASVLNDGAIAADHSNTAPVSALPVPDPAKTTEQTKAATIDRLMELGANTDTASLSTILLELENPDKDVREAALEAAIQFGERTNTIARLRELAERVQDETERTAIREAIEYIQLPSLTEYLATRKAATPGAGTLRPQTATAPARMPRMPVTQAPTPPR